MIQIEHRRNILWLTTTALFIALVIAVQAAGAGVGQPLVGPLVNMTLVIAVMSNGSVSGLAVSMLSPVFAKLLGIGPLWAIVPFLMAGNAALVLAWHWVGRLRFTNKILVRALALVLAAACKFAVLYIGVVRVAVPLLLHLPAPQAAAVSSMFALPQLLTALAGGALAMAVLPVMERIKIKATE